MPKYIIEREIRGVENFSVGRFEKISQTFRQELNKIEPKIQCFQNYIGPDKLQSIYIAPNVKMIFEHTKQGEFPSTAISEVVKIVAPNEKA